MIFVSVQGDTKDILKDLTHTQKSVIVPSQNAAINRTAQGVITRGVRQASHTLGIAQKHIRGRIYLQRSNFERLYALIKVYPQRMSLYKARGAAAIRKIPHGFFATMPNEHTGIFFRKPHAKAKRSPNSGQWTQLPIDEATIDVYNPLTTAFEYQMKTFAPGEYRKVFAREMQRRSKQSPARRRLRR